MNPWLEKFNSAVKRIDGVKPNVYVSTQKYYSLFRVFEGFKRLIGLRLLYDEAVVLSKIAGRKLTRIQVDGETLFEMTQLEIVEEV